MGSDPTLTPTQKLQFIIGYRRTAERPICCLSRFGRVAECQVDAVGCQPFGPATEGVRVVAGPLISLGCIDHGGTHRVLFDVPQARQPIALVPNRKGSVPAIPDCSSPLVRAIVVRAILR